MIPMLTYIRCPSRSLFFADLPRLAFGAALLPFLPITSGTYGTSYISASSVPRITGLPSERRPVVISTSSTIKRGISTSTRYRPRQPFYGPSIRPKTPAGELSGSIYGRIIMRLPLRPLTIPPIRGRASTGGSSTFRSTETSTTSKARYYYS